MVESGKDLVFLHVCLVGIMENSFCFVGNKNKNRKCNLYKSTLSCPYYLKNDWFVICAHKKIEPTWNGGEGETTRTSPRSPIPLPLQTKHTNHTYFLLYNLHTPKSPQLNTLNISCRPSLYRSNFQYFFDELFSLNNETQ